MKLSTIYHAIFAGLAIGVSAGPVLIGGSSGAVDYGIAHTFDTRAPPKGLVMSSRYKDAVAAAAKAGKKLVPEKFFVSTTVWDLPSSVEGTFESKTELEKLDFDAQFMDLVKDDD